jgi:hypothetical protein
MGKTQKKETSVDKLLKIDTMSVITSRRTRGLDFFDFDLGFDGDAT